MNQHPTFQKLPTDRSFSKLMIRGVCSFAFLGIIDMIEMQKDLDKIITPYTSKRANFMFFGRKTAKILNEELSRRGISYHLSTLFFQPIKAITALNLLSEDYNQKGC